MLRVSSLSIHLFAAAFTAAVFAADLFLPLGVAGAVPYAGSAMISHWTGGQRSTIAYASLGTALTLLGIALSPPGGEMWKVLVNRGLAIVVLWSTAMLILGRKKKDRALETEFEVSRFDATVQRALDLADDETDTLNVIERALASISPGTVGEVLIANNSCDQLERAFSGGDPGCEVREFSRCAAIRRGNTLLFDDLDALDACPFVRNRQSNISATCVPLSILGQHVGVIHVEGRKSLSHSQIARLQNLSFHVGMRLSMIRTLSATQVQAQTDPLTGLLNRRSFEGACVTALRVGQQHVVALLDLDDFKKLNDMAGHEAGDRALSLFSELLTTSVRGADLVGRHGGEEFVVFLAETDSMGAMTVFERLREQLANAASMYAGPSFTFSGGLATFPEDGTNLHALLRVADTMLFKAKHRGRNCVVAQTDKELSEVETEPSEVETEPSEVETEPSEVEAEVRYVSTKMRHLG